MEIDIGMRQIAKDQDELLALLVEAERRVPKDQRHPFVVHTPAGIPGVALIHPGWQGPGSVFQGDIEVLAHAGLVNFTTVGVGVRAVYVTPAGFAYYEDQQRSHGEPLERIERAPLRFISGEWFHRNYPAAYAKWKEAESLLWAQDTDVNLSAVGHFTREALQEFADTLVRRLSIQNIEPDKARVNNRIRAAIEARRAQLPTSVPPLLDAMLNYWTVVVGLVQRQEHAGQREGEPLTAVDAQRVVLHTAILMHELHHNLDRR